MGKGNKKDKKDNKKPTNKTVTDKNNKNTKNKNDKPNNETKKSEAKGFFANFKESMVDDFKGTAIILLVCALFHLFFPK